MAEEVPHFWGPASTCQAYVSKAPLWGVVNLKCSFLDPLEPGPLRMPTLQKKVDYAALSTLPVPSDPSLFLWVLAQDSTPGLPGENSGL